MRCGLGVGIPIGFTGPGQGVGSVGGRLVGGTTALVVVVGLAGGVFDVVAGTLGALVGIGVGFTFALGVAAGGFTGITVGTVAGVAGVSTLACFTSGVLVFFASIVSLISFASTVGS